MLKATHQLTITFATMLLWAALRADAQWSWSSGVAAIGEVIIFPSSGVTASGRTVVFESGHKPLPNADAIRSVQPEYPYDDRANGHQGMGFFRMIIDSKTGLVTRVLTETSTGFKTLDESVINAGMQWRWKPATWEELNISCYFRTWTGHGAKRLDEWRY